MTDRAVQICRRSEIVRDLESRYPQLEDHAALRIVVEGVRALAALELDKDEEADRLLSAMAERRVRLLLGLDLTEARLDPQPHHSRHVGENVAD